MAWYTYAYKAAFDPSTLQLATDATGQVYAVDDTAFANPIPTYDLTGVPVELTSNSLGFLPEFQVEDHVELLWKSGEYVFHLNTTTPLVGPQGDKGEDGSNVLPTSEAIAAELDNDASESRGILDALYSVKGAAFANAKDYGAVGDGVADDAAAINAALSAGKGVVVVPPGTYRLASQLTLRANTTLFALGATFIRDHAGVLLRNYETTDVFTGYAGNNNVRVIGGTWDNRGGVWTTNRSGCLYFAHSEHITVQHATLKDVYSGHAMELAGVRHMKIENCRFLGLFNPDPTNEYFTEAIQIEACLNGAFQGGAYDLTPTHHVTVQGCYFGNSTTSGAAPWPVAVGAHSSAYNVQYEGIRVINNRIEGASYYGIRPYRFSRSVIFGNDIRNGTGGGIYVTTPPAGTTSTVDANGVAQAAQSSYSNLIEGNHISGTGSHGIRVDGQAGATVLSQKIIGNFISNVTGNGIIVGYLQDSVILNNTIETTSTHAVYVQNCADVRLAGNDIKSAGGNGITITLSSTDIVFEGNKINGANTYGVSVDGTTKGVQVVGNSIRNVSQTTEGANDGILISTGATAPRVVSNVVRTDTGKKRPRYGLNVQSTVTQLVRYGNDFRANPVTGALVDGSTTPTTTSADITA